MIIVVASFPDRPHVRSRSGNWNATRLEGEELVHAIKLVVSQTSHMYRLPLFVVRRSVSTATALRMPIKVDTSA